MSAAAVLKDVVRVVLEHGFIVEQAPVIHGSKEENELKSG